MNRLTYKRKISKSLEAMDTDELKQAWLILKEIGSEKKTPATGGKKRLENQLTRGIQQLENGEGTDFGSFIGKLKKKYGKR